MHSPILMFHSTRFAAEPGEDLLTNPGIVGRQLAEWLAVQLPKQGYATGGDVMPEDFGWCVPVADEHCALHVACANAEEGGWQTYVFAESSLMFRLLDHDPRPAAVSALFNAVRAILQQAQGIDSLHSTE